MTKGTSQISRPAATDEETSRATGRLATMRKPWRSSRAIICGCLSLLLLVHGASRPGEPLHPSEISCIYARETGNASEPCDYQDVPGALLRIDSDYPSDDALINQSHFVWPAHFLTLDLNQHEPRSCGSCWAHAAYSSLADRLKIKCVRDGESCNHDSIAFEGGARDIIPSIQSALDCSGKTCSGGDALALMAWTASLDPWGVPDSTCRGYSAETLFAPGDAECAQRSHDGGMEGEGAAAADRREKGLAFCRWCTALGCAPIPAEGYDGIRVIAYGSVQTDAAVMAEVKMNGPVACSINAFCILPGMENRTTGIFDYRCEVSSTKTACNSSSLIISASVTLLFGQCDR